MSLRIAINGFGRIGRLAARQILQDDQFELVAINDLADNEALAYLYKHDSVHGKVAEDVSLDGDTLVVGDKRILMTSNRDLLSNDWAGLGVDLVLECTGLFTKREDAKGHLDAGAKKVLISAPASDPDLTVVLGVNDALLDPETQSIVSNASCTTNCAAPPLKALDDAFGVEYAVLNTIHAYTMSQSVLDGPRKKLRQGRAAALNLIPTSTGAAKAVGLVIPHLNGKLNGMAVRTPNPTGSLVDLTVTLKKDATVEQVHDALRAYAEANPTILEFSTEEIVSTDIIGSTYSSIIDSQMTMKVGPMVKLLAWYDNEAGYATRLVDLARRFG